MNEKQKMLAGEMYNPADTQLAEMRQRARRISEELNNTSQQHRLHRDHLIRELFGSTGEQIQIESPFHCDYGENIHVGENFFANFGCVILDVAEVRFGDNCMLAPQVGIYTATHPLDPRERCSGLEYAKPITIGDNGWIGGMAVINPGVTLGNNVVVASGAVVTKSFGDNVVLAGNPARVIRTLEPGSNSSSSSSSSSSSESSPETSP
ncbi:sugar O-acetyltransferase [Microbulbifer bruguierae]|uniref:Acetyltransferase n=1 Tax=Microbulbifer bruguierae TaxID=3029061 RepID=A0ABY8N819_9GAMM|nr:sugar O-acetyltransferase [Microbulbifer bruguierae]WGL15046.1 sugar O-acetyltransferase [Microbulbifer bruguierae]